jgi:hypothetical protein
VQHNNKWNDHFTSKLTVYFTPSSQKCTTTFLSTLQPFSLAQQQSAAILLMLKEVFDLFATQQSCRDISHASAAYPVNIIQEVLDLFGTFMLVPDKDCTQKKTGKLFARVDIFIRFPSRSLSLFKPSSDATSQCSDSADVASYLSGRLASFKTNNSQRLHSYA